MKAKHPSEMSAEEFEELVTCENSVWSAPAERFKNGNLKIGRWKRS